LPTGGATVRVGGGGDMSPLVFMLKEALRMPYLEEQPFVVVWFAINNFTKDKKQHNEGNMALRIISILTH
jgi:hypothetical protein